MDFNNTTPDIHNADNNISVDQWFFMDSPVPLMTVMVSYWLFVLKLGPMYMKNKEAYNLSNVLVLYNAMQVFVSLVISVLGIYIIARSGLFKTDCSKQADDLIKIATVGTYMYVLTKITELLDTVFFILRKKYNQASFLHIYHHSFAAICAWCILKYEPNVNAILFLGTLNSMVHVVMYTYYGLSAYPKLAKYLWWKKYITKLQLIQFVVVLVHMLTEYKISKCKPSYILISVMTLNLALFFYLFSNFYSKTYKKQESVNDMKMKVH